jgi:uncharacterized protein YdaU (DUF1376 family)
MSQFPFMPLFIDAYLADTTHFSAEEHGAYLLLLMAMWRRNGSVPNDDRDLARMCCVNVRRWPRVKARLLPLLTEKDGELSQKKLYAVLGELRNRKAQKRSSDKHTKVNGIKGLSGHSRARVSKAKYNNLVSTELYAREWPPPSQLIPRVYPNGRAAAKNGDETALDPLPGAPEKPKKETRQ